MQLLWPKLEAVKTVIRFLITLLLNVLKPEVVLSLVHNLTKMILSLLHRKVNLNTLMLLQLNVIKTKVTVKFLDHRLIKDTVLQHLAVFLQKLFGKLKAVVVQV